jgi:6-phosphogluconolactonase
MKPILHIDDSPRTVAATAARHFFELIMQLVGRGRAINVGLSGGSTPFPVYELLLTEYRTFLQWKEEIHWYFVDERCVPQKHKDNTFAATRNVLLREEFFSDDLVAQTAHFVRTDNAPKHATLEYEQFIHGNVPCDNPYYSKIPSFDILFLGMGDDGHIASLFPQSKILQEKDALIAAVTESPKPPPERITWTLPLINATKHIFFVAHGANKAQAVKASLTCDKTVLGYATPASMVNSMNPIHWFLDEQSASLIEQL